MNERNREAGCPIWRPWRGPVITVWSGSRSRSRGLRVPSPTHVVLPAVSPERDFFLKFLWKNFVLALFIIHRTNNLMTQQPCLECFHHPDPEFYKEEGGRQNFLAMGVRVPLPYPDFLTEPVRLATRLHLHPSLQPFVNLEPPPCYHILAFTSVCVYASPHFFLTTPPPSQIRKSECFGEPSNVNRQFAHVVRRKVRLHAKISRGEGFGEGERGCLLFVG